MPVETITIEGEVLTLDELEALLEPLADPLTREELQALIAEANRDASSPLLELLSALVVLSIAATLPRSRIAYSIRDKAYYRGRSALPREDIRRRLSEEQMRNGARMRQRTQDMIDGRVRFEEWQRQSIGDIIGSHYRMTQAGAGTASGLTRQHIERLRTTLREEIGYFQQFATQVSNGELSEAMMLYRASRYAFSSAASYWIAEQISHSDGRWMGRRVLDSTARHCPECPAYEQPDWVPVSEIVPVGDACSCRGRCRCQTFYRQASLSDRLIQ